MEALKLPMRELKKRYTRSELFILAWRSAEIAHNMGENAKPRTPSQHPTVDIDDAYESALERRLGSIANKITDKDGEVDLHGLTGKEVLNFFGALGVKGRA